MGLLATLPRATRGHLGAANNSLTRATRGYLQGVQVVRRPGGGLFAPPLKITEPRRRIKTLLLLALDGNSHWQITRNLEIILKPSGRLWLTGASVIRLGRRASIQLRAISPRPELVRPIKPIAEDAEPVAAPILRRRLATIHRRGSAGVVISLDSRIKVSKALAPIRIEGAGGGLWIDARSKIRRFQIEIDTNNRSDEEIMLIAALLAKEIGNG